ncbi:MAG TPA: hypothetical protein ENG41_04155 [Methanomicrobia archaeon]|nr:hypothetical protein [Methanomicrobia archaeon]
MEKKEGLVKLPTKYIDLSRKQIDAYAILSFLSLLTGVIFYVLWAIYYGVWFDIGIYAPSAIFILLGVFGLLYSFLKE